MRPPPCRQQLVHNAAAAAAAAAAPRSTRVYRGSGQTRALLLGLLLIFLLGDTRSQQSQYQQQQQQQQQKYSTRLVHTRYGSLRGTIARTSEATVEVYLGVPYATPPLGSLRYMPPITPSPWRGTRLADAPPPACPQRPPRPEPAMPRMQRAYLQRLGPTLANQSEDCLYLNLYVPRPPAVTLASAAAASSPSPGSSELLPALLLIHGDSYTWGAGNPLDGTALAAHGRIIVVSINFRLGILGFLKTSSKGSAQGNYGLMDLVAGVHWLKENLAAFGGDSNRLTLLGHGTGAALANFLAVSPMTKELIERVVLLGGSSLSPWAVQREPMSVKRRVAELVGCSGDIETEDIAPCLRLRNVDELLEVKLDVPRFTSGFAPFIDGAILPASLLSNLNLQPTASSSGLMPLMPGPGSEFANFGDMDVLMGLTSDEAWLELTEQDLEDGLNETRRDRILRTYVRNTYRYHLHEIYSTLRNEYTDWERGEPSPQATCEGLLALLGDGQVAAPLLRLALLHSSSGGRGYFLHFQPGDRPSMKGEELPFLLGLPLLRSELTGGDYSLADEGLARLMVHYLSNFVRRGDPNGAAMSSMNSVAWAASADVGISSPPFWDSYDSINQLYLEAGRNTEMRSHYRGHKMSLWLNLLPQLHRPGYEVSMRHHHLAESPALYEGAVRPQSMAMPIPAPPLPLPHPTEPSISSSAAAGSSESPASTTDCTPNLTTPSLPAQSNTQQPNLGPGPYNLLRKLASSHYQSHTTALTVTITIGIVLLFLNIFIFAGIYYQRDKSGCRGGGLDQCAMAALADKEKDDLLEIGGFSSSVLRDPASQSGKLMGPHTSKRSLSTFVLADSPTDSPMTTTVAAHSTKFVDELEHLQLQEYECSQSSYYCPSPSLLRNNRTPSPCVDATMAAAGLDDDDLPDPPPPPKSPAPVGNLMCPGILRQPGTPGSTKKRVQIQEISV